MPDNYVPPSAKELDFWPHCASVSEADIKRLIREVRRLRELCKLAAPAIPWGNEACVRLQNRLRAAAEGEK